MPASRALGRSGTVWIPGREARKPGREGLAYGASQLSGLIWVKHIQASAYVALLLSICCIALSFYPNADKQRERVTAEVTAQWAEAVVA